MKTRPLPPVMNLMVGTAGHIDHGKTSLVKFFTGCETDTLREEKDRGMSINLGFAPCPLGPGKRIGLVDVPGHEDFIRNMVAGATGMDILILVVAADDGIMPQTIEHFNITDLLEVKKGVVVISKTDLVPPERVEEVRAEVTRFVKGTYLEGAPIFPFSAVTAEGLMDLRKMLDSVVEETERRPTDGVFRLPVERSFSAEGFGTIMTGIAARGKISVRDEVEILPIGQKGVVRKLQVFAQDWNEGFAGQCMAVNVGGVDHKVVKRGSVLATAGFFKPTDLIHARLRVLRDAAGPLNNQTQIRFHTGTTETYGRVILLDKDFLEPGESGLVQFRLDETTIVEPGDRYIIRLQNPVVSVGGGRVIGRSDKKLKRKRQWAIDTIIEEEASHASHVERAEFVVKNSGRTAIELKEVGVGATLTPEQTKTVVGTLTEKGEVIVLPGNRLVVHASHFASYKEDLIEKLNALHQAEPLRIGYSAVRLRKETDVRTELASAALDSLVAESMVVLDKDLYRLASFTVQLDDELSRISDAIEKIYIDGAFKTVRPDDLPGSIDGKEADIRNIFQQLVDGGVLIKVDPKVAFHRDHVEQARQNIVAHIKEKGELDSFDFKNLIDSSRKYAIPLLDYFDAIGVTVRGHQNKRYLKS